MISMCSSHVLTDLMHLVYILSLTKGQEYTGKPRIYNIPMSKAGIIFNVITLK